MTAISLRIGGILRGWRLPTLGSKRRVVAKLVECANALRDKGGFAAAATLYEQALTLAPRNAGLHVQCGHMHKEAGDLAAAHRQYQAAQSLIPGDADLALQMGHFYKVARRPDAALGAYAHALSIRPGWRDALVEIERLGARAQEPTGPGDFTGLAPQLAPSAAAARTLADADGHDIWRLGARRDRSGCGMIGILSGVEAIRGRCTSRVAIVELLILLDGEAIYVRRPDPATRTLTLNEWVDFSGIPPGRHTVETRCIRADGSIVADRRPVLVAAPAEDAEQAASDAAVVLPADREGSIEARIAALPSVVRPARRVLFPGGIRSVLVVRADQLGDMVCSVPALRRLRALLPDARLVGLVTAASAAFADTLGLLDETIVIDFPEDPAHARRVLALDAQARLRRTLHQRRFDLAIDLAESSASRPLLLLSGARFRYGFHDEDSPWLTAGFVANAHDPRNDREIATPASKILALVERLGTLIDSGTEIVRRPGLGRAPLARFGLDGHERYAVLHAGARLAFTRWPHFAELAARLIREEGLGVVLLAEDPPEPGTLPSWLLDDDRFHLVEGQLPFDELDALLSFCALFVGNDSGPKHLAALRGAPVVSIHSARVNWNEWGQELTGSIVSRRVPCAGCGISNGDDCGKDFACIRLIGVDEVLDAARALLVDDAADAGSLRPAAYSC